MRVNRIGRVTSFILSAVVLFFFIRNHWLEYETLILVVIFLLFLQFMKLAWHWLLRKWGKDNQHLSKLRQKRESRFELIGYLTMDVFNWLSRFQKKLFCKSNE